MFDRVMNMAPQEERVDVMDYLNADENLSAGMLIFCFLKLFF